MSDYFARLIYKGLLAIVGLIGATILGIYNVLDSQAIAAIYAAIITHTLNNNYPTTTTHLSTKDKTRLDDQGRET